MPGLDGTCEPLTTVEEMAERYVASIRRSYPHGPYSLGGWSVGGVLAYEMAQRLHAEGQEVRTLAIMDSGVLSPCGPITGLFPKGGPGALDIVRQPAADQVAGFR